MPGISIMLEQHNNNLNRLAMELGDKNLNKASVRAINKAIAKSNTSYRRLIRDNYNLKYAETKDMVIAKKATYGQPTGTISARVNPLSLSRFNPSYVMGGQVFSIKSAKNKETGKTALQRKMKKATKKDQQRGGVTFTIKKGQTKTLPFAFFTSSDKNIGVAKQVFARGTYIRNTFQTGKSRNPIQALKSVSPFGMMSKHEISKEVERGASLDMQKEFERQIELLLKNAGAK